VKHRDLVYEIGTEEIPASYLPPAARQLRDAAEAFLRENRLKARNVETHATPRRLVLFVQGLPVAQEDRTEEVTGPPWKAAFDAEGKPTRAAEGFARGRGLSIDDLHEVQTERGPYVGATVTIEGRRTGELLASALPEITGQLDFPKTMVWGPARFEFARPIRWILALWDGDIIPFEIEGVASGRTTFGHRILAKGPFRVKKASDYEAALAKGRVALRTTDRARTITGLLEETAKQVGGHVVSDPGLVEEVSYLVESPSVFASDFDEEFLELPAAVIRTAMRDHQRYFAVEGADGELLPRFLCVTNSSAESVERVKDGNRRVLRARLDDARFYWNEDLKTKLVDKVPELGAVVWLDGFGSLEDKTRRIEKLAGGLAEVVAPQEMDAVARAALLSKTDLVTEMIRDGKEFTSLQGVMGRAYALENGEPKVVALALEEQYRPRFAGDGLPSTGVGAALAVADRLDTMVGVWAAGLRPTGSKDPFGLRRGALGVIRILLDRDLRLSVGELVERAADGYGARLEGRAELVEEVSEFVLDRLAQYLSDEEGIDADVVAAVVPWAGGNPVEARARCEALGRLRSQSREDFEALAAGFKRAKNILKKDRAAGPPSESLLVEAAERDLFHAFASVDRDVTAAESEQRYGDAFAGLARLRTPIDTFFDSVMVLTDDESLRENRLRLLGRIVDRVQGLADLSRLATREETKV
jgi:glycyl-tRNA synthetase beta chain